MHSRSAWAALIFAVLAVLGLFALVGRQPSGRPGTPSAERPMVTMFRPTLIAYDEQGRKVLEIVCRLARLARDGRTYTIEGLERATLFRDGEPAMVLRADRGTYNETSRDASLSGNVKALSADGFLFETDTITWIYRKKLVLVPGPLAIKFGEIRVDTQLARYSVEEQLLECPNPLRASTARDRLQCDRLRGEGKNHRVALLGKVRLTGSEGLTMQCPELWYDYQNQRAWVPGQVSVQYRALRAETRDIEYLAEESILRCPRPISASLGPDRLRADSLIVDGIRRRAAFHGNVTIAIEPTGAEARLGGLRPSGGKR